MGRNHIVAGAPGRVSSGARPNDGSERMRKTVKWTALALAGLLAGCGSASAQRHAHPPPPPAPAAQGGDADARFLRDMIVHHQQALEMVALVPGRSARPEVALIAERIQVSQRDEIAIMRRWLEARGHADSSSAHGAHDMSAHAGHDMAAPPGLASPEEMARLAAASGPAFDRMFLELMIRHHQGALAMVAALLETAGAAQDPAVFGMASDVDADQRMEIARMRALLDAAGSSPAPR